MIPLLQARAEVEHRLADLPPVAAETWGAALGRVLRKDVVAPTDIPAFDRSAVDGYATHGSSETFRVIGTVSPGASAECRLASGEGVRIYTGSVVPADASKVIMQEDVEREGDVVTVRRQTEATHIRRRGEDARQGGLLIPSGTRLGPGDAALLAQIGVLHPLVSPAPKVLHVVTGNELVAPSQTPGPGEIRDSNSTLMAALLAEYGAILVHQSWCQDSLESLTSLITQQAASWDMLLVSGGASVGDYDFGKRALRQLGFEIHFEKVNIRPGKPLVFGTRGQQIAFVIPGNPVAHLVTFHLLIRHALERLEGSRESWALAPVTLADAIPSPPDQRETWWPSRVRVDQGVSTAQPLPWQSSGDLCGIVGTNALLRVPCGSGPHEAGTVLECLLLDHRF